MKKFSITFYIKKDKTNENGQAAIYCKIKVDETESTFSTKKWIELDRWKETKHLNITRNDSEKEIRKDLGKIETGLKQVFEKAENKGMVISAEELKDFYFNPEKPVEPVKHTLMELLDLHTEMFWQKVKVGLRSKASHTKFKSVQFHVKDFLNDVMKVQDIELEKLNYAFVERFDLYMRTNKKCENNTTVKYVQFLRSVISTGMKHEWLIKDPFIRYEGRLVEVETHFLTEEQLKRIQEKVFAVERLNVVRDIFLFSCYTGYAPVDIAKLTWNDVIKNVDGQLWIYTERTKTKVKANVPLLPPAIHIIEKYRNHPRCIEKNLLVPHNSNQKMNQYLKEIGDVCKIPFDLCYYCARHTFATTVTLLNGISLETVSKLLGHKRITQTQTYARVVNDKVSREMKSLYDKFDNKPKGENDCNLQIAE